MPTQRSRGGSLVTYFTMLQMVIALARGASFHFNQRHYTHAIALPTAHIALSKSSVFDTATLHSITLTSHIYKHTIAILYSQRPHISSFLRRISPPIPSDLISIAILTNLGTPDDNGRPSFKDGPERQHEGRQALASSGEAHLIRLDHPICRLEHRPLLDHRQASQLRRKVNGPQSHQHHELPRYVPPSSLKPLHSTPLTAHQAPPTQPTPSPPHQPPSTTSTATPTSPAHPRHPVSTI